MSEIRNRHKEIGTAQCGSLFSFDTKRVTKCKFYIKTFQIMTKGVRYFCYAITIPNRKEGAWLNPTERRTAIYAVIVTRRYDTVPHLAVEFDVSERTILRDIMFLTLSYPVETVRGCRGGVKLSKWFKPTDRVLNDKQVKLLRRIEPHLNQEDRIVLNSILLQFAPR